MPSSEHRVIILGGVDVSHVCIWVVLVLVGRMRHAWPALLTELAEQQHSHTGSLAS